MKTPSKAKSPSDLPLPVVIEELTYLRKTFRELVGAYSTGVESEIAHLHAINDLRAMLMKLRSLDVKPAKGRRRDLKRVENMVGELSAISDRWT